MGRVKFVLNLISFSSSLLGPIFYFYIYVSSSDLSYCSIKHDDDDDDDDDDAVVFLMVGLIVTKATVNMRDYITCPRWSCPCDEFIT